MSRASLLVFVVLLAGYGQTGTAAAQRVIAPPGLSGVDEYLETVPGAGGAERPGGTPPGTTRGTGHAPATGSGRAGALIPPATGKALDRAGKDGEAVKRLALANSPSITGSSAGPGHTLALDEGTGDGPLGSVLNAVTTSGGSGLLYPIAPLALVAALAGLAIARRRSSS